MWLLDPWARKRFHDVFRRTVAPCKVLSRCVRIARLDLPSTLQVGVTPVYIAGLR